MTAYAKTLVTVALAASTAFAQAQGAPAGCNNTPQAEAKQPGFWDKATAIGGKIAGDIVGGAVNDATRGLGNQAGRVVREASGDLARHTGEAQRQARNTVNQASRAATTTAKNTTRNAASTAKSAFEDCSTPRSATPVAPQAAPAPTEAGSAPANNAANDPGQQNMETLKDAAGTVGGWLKNVPIFKP